MDATNGRTVLVGLDNTPAARAALRWAIGYAARTGAIVHAVHAFELSGTDAARLEPDLAGTREIVQGRAHAWVADGLGDLSVTVPVVVEVEDGAAAAVLGRAARAADIVVVGDNRGDPTTSPPLLRRCAVPASCDIVVVDRSGRAHRLDRAGQETS